MNMQGREILVGLALIAFGAPAARAATWRVANNGVDAKGCGLRTACRSISQAIANAKNGDSIVVGPGVYGDIDGDDVFHSPGDERGPGLGHFSVIWVNKRVRIVSEAGASATVIVPGNSKIPTKVLITASGATFGERDHGFSITADYFDPRAPYATGVRTTAATHGVEIGGNVVLQMRQGFRIYGRDHTLAFNRATANAVGFDVRGRHVDLHDNAVIGNDKGFDITESGASVEHNAVVGNSAEGVQVVDGVNIGVGGNSIVGNPTHGILVRCPGFLCKPAFVAVRGNSIFGNGGQSNCGLVNLRSGNVLAADLDFWGTPAGPGPDPADQICNVGNGTTAYLPTAPVEITVDLPAQH